MVKYSFRTDVKHKLLFLTFASLLVGSNATIFAQDGNSSNGSNNTSNGTVTSNGSDTSDKENSSSSVPQNIKELSGKKISFSNRSEYISEGRPWDTDKMFLLYNVGTGKFLNVGSYWGTHAVLSDVPRPFWFQRRNDTKVTALYGYKRYPQSEDTNIDFIDQFAAIKNYQIGSTYSNEGNGTSKSPTTIHSHVKYNYIKVIGKDEDAATAGTSLCQSGYEPNGTTFSYSPSVDLNTQKVVAQIDLTNCTAQYTSGGQGQLENIFSMGKDISKWDYSTYDVHIFASKTTDGVYQVRVQCLNGNYSDATQKKIINITESNIENNVIDIIITKESILVAGVECMPARKTISTENPIEELFEQSDIKVGSSYATHSNATYNYVKVVTHEEQTTTSENVLKPGTCYPADYSSPITFQKVVTGDLQTWGITADIDLSTCVGENENVLSIGTDIDKLEGTLTQSASMGISTQSNEASTGYYNLHFFYNAKTHKLTLYHVNSSAETTSKSVDITSVSASNQRLKVILDNNGLVVNGNTMTDENEVIKNLTDSKKTSGIEVGSQAATTDTSMGSHAIYHELAMSHAYPQAGDVWNGKKFKKQITGSLTNWNLEWTLDLSTCVGSGSNKNENILSIGSDIAKWTPTNDGGNIHLYYKPSTKILEFDAINNSNQGDQYRITKTLTDEELKAVNIKLTKDGLYLNDTLLTGSKNGDYNASNPIIHYLTYCDHLQIGSQEGEPSHATYTSENITSTGVTPSEPDEPTKPLGDYPKDGDKWDGKAFSKTYEGTLKNWSFDFTLNLTTCMGSGENILSLGNNVANWANKGDYNIHLYYTASNKKLQLNAARKTSSNSYGDWKNDNIILTESQAKACYIQLNKNGFFINGTQYSGGVLTEVIKYLTNTTTQVQVGSQEGSSRSHATYTKMTVTEAASSAKAMNAMSRLAKSVKSAASSNSTTENTSSATAYYPYKDYTADGKTAFETEAYKMSFENGDYVEAEIDITTTPILDANLFSIGTNIGIWGYDKLVEENNADNIHFFYRGKEESNALVQVVFTNKNHNNDLKKDLVIKPNAEGKLVMHIRLSKKEGLMVNDKKVYYAAADDPMPTITYNAEYAGEIVKFKYNEKGEPALDENGKYIVVDPSDADYNDAQPIRENADDYMYTTDDRANDEMPVFITSQFNLESGASTNEGSYLSWSPYLANNNKWGTIGVFADRNLPQSDLTSEMAQKTSEWFFKPVEGKTHTYRIYLKMDNMEVAKRDLSASNKYSFENQSGNFLLTATNDHVYGNGMENYGGSFSDDKEDSELDGVEAICGDLDNSDENCQWKIFDVKEYYGLFKAANSEMSMKLNLTYSMRDPDFTRENADLSKWIVEGGMQGKNQVQIGFDQYTKKYDTTLKTPGFQSEYTDYDGKRDISKNGTVIESGNEQFKFAKNHLNNHGRYMGVQVTNGGHGKFYQENLQIIHPGWYVISCGGLSNVGAKLFVVYNEHTMTQDLHHVTQEEIDYFNATDKVWPYDQCTLSDGTVKPMPFYNALVAMNDENADYGTGDLKNLKDKLTTQIAFYVSEAEANTGKTVTFGIEIPETSELTADGTTSDWTVFDNFHLLFGGDNANDPNLMLDENATDLGYLDRSMHIFKDRPMRLNRTFDPGNWNTLVLPVSLTKEQFITLLDNDTEAQLLKIKEIKGNHLIFTPETEETEGGVYFRANKPYLVKTSKAQGQADAYTARIYHWADGGKTYEEVAFPTGHFVTFNVTLAPVNNDVNSGKKLYDFAYNNQYKTEIGGTTYDYVVNRNKTVTDEDVAYDMTTGTKNENRYATFYGTLCKTYAPDANGKNAILEGRPKLDDGKSFYMKPNGGDNFYYRKQGSGYGLKGFRCWFVFEDGTGTTSGAAAAKQFAIDINGVTDDVTDISTIERSDGEVIADQYAHGIYTLSGQKVTEGKRLSDLPSGIYIVNGKKYIVNK